MSHRFFRNLLVVLGAYLIGEWLAQLIRFGEAAMEISYSGSDRLGELWILVASGAHRFLGAVAATTLLWFTLGQAETKRWMWALAALFALSGLTGRVSYRFRPDPVSQTMDFAVQLLLPALGCLAAFWLSRRFASPGPDNVSSAGDAAPQNARSRTLLAAWSIVMVIAGVFVGMWFATFMKMEEASDWTVVALEHAQRSDYAMAQYREAGYEEARAALEQFAAYLESLQLGSTAGQPVRAPFLDADGLAFDRMLTYGRLALRAERANRPDDANGYWQKAEEHAIALNWEEPTSDRIRDTVTRLDAGAHVP